MITTIIHTVLSQRVIIVSNDGLGKVIVGKISGIKSIHVTTTTTTITTTTSKSPTHTITKQSTQTHGTTLINISVIKLQTIGKFSLSSSSSLSLVYGSQNDYCSTIEVLLQCCCDCCGGGYSNAAVADLGGGDDVIAGS